MKFFTRKVCQKITFDEQLMAGESVSTDFDKLSG